MKTTLACLTLAWVLIGASPVFAQGEETPGESPPGSYWSTIFQGGVLTPLGDMTALHQSSLAGGGRLGWTSRIGLGVDIAAEYSPLSRKSDLSGDIYESHFVIASLMPRYTLGKKMLRLWLAAGGGLAYEHSKLTAAMGTGAVASDKYAPVGVGAAGLEFHIIPGMGLAVIGTYARTRGDLQYEILNITGGFSFTFR